MIQPKIFIVLLALSSLIACAHSKNAGVSSQRSPSQAEVGNGSVSLGVHGWTEVVECFIKRGPADPGSITTDFVSKELKLQGPHNGEHGEVVITSALIPSYTVTYSKYSGGRSETSELTTKLGNKLMAKSSTDTSIDSSISNVFLTANFDYQVSVTCKTKVK